MYRHSFGACNWFRRAHDELKPPHFLVKAEKEYLMIFQLGANSGEIMVDRCSSYVETG